MSKMTNQRGETHRRARSRAGKLVFESAASKRRGNITGLRLLALPRAGPDPYGSLCSSTRRFCARPAADVLGATGLREP